MNPLQNFLQNLRIGGASNIPKSKLEQDLTHDSELDSPLEPPQQGEQDKNVELKPVEDLPPKIERKKIVKQKADIEHESSEFEDKKDSDVPKEERVVAAAVDKPVPISRQSVPKSNDSDNEDIKEIWRELNIGADGYLTLPELEKMCNYLEMTEMDTKDMQNLFVSIDTDKDNRVSMSEFSNGLKTHSQLKHAADEREAKRHAKKRPRNNSLKLSHAAVPPLVMPDDKPLSLFSALDQNKKGLCYAEKIMEYWASGGILNGNEVLEYFNYKPNEMVNLNELSASLEREMLQTDLDAVTLSGLISYKKELHYCRSMLEELLGRIMKLNKEISSIEYENSQLKSKLAEVQDINIRQEDELDAVAELHRKMESELKLLRDTKIIFNQTMTKNDRDELYELKKKFEQHFEMANHNCLQKNSDSEYTDGLRKDTRALGLKLSMSEKKVNELDRKLQLKVDEVQYLKREINDTKFHQKETEKEQKDQKYHNLEKSNSAQMQRVEESRVENDKLRNKIHSLECKIDIAINREKAYRIRIEELEHDCQKGQNIEKSIIELNNKLSEATRTYEKKLENYSQRIEELQNENKEMNKSYHHMESQMVGIKEEILERNEDIRNKNKQIEHKKNEITDLSDTLTMEREDGRSNRILIEKLELANDRLSKSLMNAVEKMDEFSKQVFDSDSKNALNENIKIRKENMLLEDEVSQLSRRLAAAEISQSKDFNKEIQNLQRQNKEREETIEELEERLHKNSTDLRCDRFGSAKKIEKIQFKYEELNKKYQLQLEQVDKVDGLLRELYEENTKLVKSLQRSDAKREQSEIKIIQLEEKVKTLQNILNRAP